MRYIIAIPIAVAAMAFGTPSVAADIVRLMNTTPVLSVQSSKSMYDLERCMIAVDSPVMPQVYRQPDQPERVMFVWDGTGGGLGGVSAAARIDGIKNGKVTFWGREKILRRIQPCLE